MLRRNPYIFAKNTGGRAPDGKGLEIFNLVDLCYNAGFTLEDGSFAVPSTSIVFMEIRMLIGEKGNGQDSVLPLTLYVIADLNTQEGIELVTEALKFIVRLFTAWSLST